MKKLSIILITLAVLFTAACRKTEKPAVSTIDVSLTETEKAGGVLTPEILWKYGRLG